MSRPNILRIAAGLLLVVAGLAIVLLKTPRDRPWHLRSGECAMSVHMFEPDRAPERGSVIVLHGLAANEKLMGYYTRGFLGAGLRVIVPDLPGHGGSPGPFSPPRAESCSEALLLDAIRRGEAEPSRTILFGHSLGAAIALRIGSRIPVAGVIALSPAPMLPVEGASSESLLYRAPERLPQNSLILAGGLESSVMRRAAARLVPELPHGVARFELIPAASHTSLLWDARPLRASLDWTASALHLEGQPSLPSRSFYLGFFAGLAGVLLLIGAMLRAILQPRENPADEAFHFANLRRYIQMAMVSVVVVTFLRFTGPMKSFGVYTGDYLASFLFLAGCILLAVNRQHIPRLESRTIGDCALATGLSVAAGFLFFGWFRLTLATAGLNGARLWRMCLIAVALLPLSTAEEILLGTPGTQGRLCRLAEGLSLRFVAWLALAAGVFYLHSGQVLLVLMVLYLGFFSLLHRLGIDLVRRRSGSGLGAALFGAILAAAFIVLVFPLT